MPHKGYGHADCIYNSIAACERARHEALGRCTEMTQDRKQPTPCTHWAESRVGGRAVCNQHATVLLNRVLDEERKDARMNELNARIDAALARHAQFPHVWD